MTRGARAHGEAAPSLMNQPSALGRSRCRSLRDARRAVGDSLLRRASSAHPEPSARRRRRLVRRRTTAAHVAASGRALAACEDARIRAIRQPGDRSVAIEASAGGERRLLDDVGEILVEEDAGDELLARGDAALLEEALEVVLDGVG